MKILVIAAHPDDEVLGCGGTIAKLSNQGHDVSIAILGEGLTSRGSVSKTIPPKKIAHLHSQAREAAKLLGASRLILKSLPDNRMDSVPLLDVVKLTEELIAEIEPEAIYTHSGGDLNIDHAVVFRAILTATRPTADSGVREVWAFDTPSSTEWAFQRFEPIFRPNLFVDIGDTLDVKTQAISLYESEVRTYPHPRSPEALVAIAKRWGAVAGYRAAEAFELIRALR